MDIAARFFISGRVQGVFFRASTRQQAERLGLRGWAVNLPDGRVEVLAAGAAAAVQQLGEWLNDGPPSANVLGVEKMPADPAEVAGGKGFKCG